MGVVSTSLYKRLSWYLSQRTSAASLGWVVVPSPNCVPRQELTAGHYCHGRIRATSDHHAAARIFANLIQNFPAVLFSLLTAGITGIDTTLEILPRCNIISSTPKLLPAVSCYCLLLFRCSTGGSQQGL